MPKLVWARPLGFVFGMGSVVLGCWGTYRYQLGIEKEISYLTLAAPLVTVAFAMALAFASWSWKKGEFFTAVGWTLFLPAAGWFLFAANAERIHFGKEGQTAEIRSTQLAAARAREALGKQEARLTQGVISAENTARVRPNCDKIQSCREALALAASIRRDIETARSFVSEVERKEFSASPFSPPIWLLPVLVELLAVLGLKLAFGGPWVVHQISFGERRARVSMIQKVKEKVTPRPVLASSNYVSPEVVTAARKTAVQVK